MNPPARHLLPDFLERNHQFCEPNDFKLLCVADISLQHVKQCSARVHTALMPPYDE